MSSDHHFKPACDKGAAFERWDGTKKSAHDIIRLIANICSDFLPSQMTLNKGLDVLSELIPAPESRSAEPHDYQRTFCNKEAPERDEKTWVVEKPPHYETRSQEFEGPFVGKPGGSAQDSNSQHDTLLLDYDTLLQILGDSTSEYCPVRLDLSLFNFLPSHRISS